MKLLYAVAVSFLCFAAQAQQWPSRPVRLVVAYPPGGGIDVLARQLADKLAPQWSQPVVVENKPGANTIVAAESAARSTPDGYTVLMTTDATFSINPHIYARLPYDPQRDFIPVTMLVLLQQLLLANPALPADTLLQLISYARSNPGKINYASYGSGSQPHLSGEMLKFKAGIDLVHVPYKGISLAVPAVMAGEVQLTFAGIASSMAPLKAGRVKALAIGGPKRSELLPDVPTFAELGYSQVGAALWFGVLVPAATPRPVIEKMNADVNRVRGEAEVATTLSQTGIEPAGTTPERFAEVLRADAAKWKQMIREAGIAIGD